MNIIAAAKSLERSHLVDKQHAIEVIDFVLPNPCGQIRTEHLVRASVEIIVLHFYGFRSADVLVESRKTQASLAVLFNTLRFENHRIDRHNFHVFTLGIAFKIHDNHPIIQRDLGCGQSKSFARVHQLQHRTGRQAQFLVDTGHRLAFRAQGRVGIIHNLHRRFRIRESGSMIIV